MPWVASRQLEWYGAGKTRCMYLYASHSSTIGPDTKDDGSLNAREVRPPQGAKADADQSAAAVVGKEKRLE